MSKELAETFAGVDLTQRLSLAQGLTLLSMALAQIDKLAERVAALEKETLK